MEKVNLAEKLATISELWRPKIVGELNGQEVKLVKFQGTFVWHHHEHEDELFLGIRGRFRIEFRDFLLLFVGQFHRRRRFVEPFHREFVSALHIIFSSSTAFRET